MNSLSVLIDGGELLRVEQVQFLLNPPATLGGEPLKFGLHRLRAVPGGVEELKQPAAHLFDAAPVAGGQVRGQKIREQRLSRLTAQTTEDFSDVVGDQAEFGGEMLVREFWEIEAWNEAVEPIQKEMQVNPPGFSDWLLRPAADVEDAQPLTGDQWPASDTQLHALLRQDATEELHPAGLLVTGVAYSRP